MREEPQGAEGVHSDERGIQEGGENDCGGRRELHCWLCSAWTGRVLRLVIFSVVYVCVSNKEKA